MWDVLRVTETFSSEAAQYRGRIVGDVARETGRSPLNVMLDIALLDGLQTVFMQEDVPDVDDMSLAAFNDMARSDHVVYGGTDAGAHVDMIANESMPARVLRYRVNEQQSLSLAEAVHGFTAKNADALGIPGRGRLQPGNAGDVVVFDQATIGAGPAFVRNDLPGGGERMMTRASGVVYTMVNGTILYEDGHPSAARPGRLLRSGA
jgi:N-acyl-D-aspartate/D-glutamate deacylase